LDEAGGQMSDVVKLTMFVTDKHAYHKQLKPIGAAYRDFFGRYYPAMTLVEVKNLFDDEALIEIDGIAMLSAERPDGL
jgi:enamine deaminase RidA (YjgF/YER057c/UK114 family)